MVPDLIEPLALQILRGWLMVPDLIGPCFVALEGAAHSAGSYSTSCVADLGGTARAPAVKPTHRPT